MKCASVALIFCVLCGADAGSAVSGAGKDHPIVKVINLLEGLKAKSIGEGKEEAVSFTKFQYWCSTSTDTLKDAIADEKEKIDELEDYFALAFWFGC